jgi:peptidyl-prolyl cis-trans isomerase A (cyclophilin A)
MFKKSISLSFIAAFLLMVTMASCDVTKKKEKEEEDAITAYLQNNSNLQFQRKESGLYYLDVQQGSGAQAVTGDTAYVKYTGKFLDGYVFDTNVGKNDTLKFPINQGYVLQGFDEGITYMRVGGKAMFLVPSYLGYGESGYFMPSYTPILFDVELVRIKPASK